MGLALASLQALKNTQGKGPRARPGNLLKIMGKLTHKAVPPKKSSNPMYISTGRKLDIKTSVAQYKPKGWMPYDEYMAMKKQEAAIRSGIKPSPDLLAILHTLGAESTDKVVQQINEWYGQHGVLRLSQVAYLNKAWLAFIS